MPDAFEGDAYDDCGSAAAICTDGVVVAAEYPANSCPSWDPPDETYTCPGECTTDFTLRCFHAGCTGLMESCADPPAAPLPAPFACDDGATCSGDATSSCGGIDACGAPTVVGSCNCAGGVETCTDACADGLCGAAAVQAALIGSWSGFVTTSSGTDALRLIIRPDGHYFTELPGPHSAFRYGPDGGGDARRFRVIGQTAAGATAIVRIFLGSAEVVDGLVRGLRVGAGHLRFDAYDPWLDCTRIAQFDLVREL